jgi:hypothetical protein
MVKMDKAVVGCLVMMAVQGAAVQAIIGMLLVAQARLAKVIMVGLVHSFGLITKRITSNAVTLIGKLVVVVVQVDLFLSQEHPIQYLMVSW